MPIGLFSLKMLGFVTWLQVLLGLNIVAVSCKKSLVKVGVILPMKGKHPWILPLARPAIDYAVANIQKDPNILPNHILVTNYKDSQCSETEGPLVAIDMYVEKSAHVFLGPACDYSVAPVARFSYKWNIPVLTAGALVSAFHDKGEYKLLTRVLGSHAMTGRFFEELCYDFGWSHVGMMYHDFKTSPNQGKSDCFFVMEAIYFAMNKRFGKPWHLHFDEEGDEVDFEAFLNEAAKKARSKICCLYFLAINCKL